MTYRNPIPTVDIIIELVDFPNRPIVAIERLNPPYGWALPGGFVDYGESVETAAVREAKEETGLDVELLEQFHVYSDPNRDPRKHTLSVVFVARAMGTPQASDDAKNLEIFHPNDGLPENLCFDHDRILQDYCNYRFHNFRPPL
ncbi:NUDIX hydrolase [Phormidium sp. CCY1219]|jgi:8-oxo-dGTP diphosphatase|uniref:NUDIX hydrolase n=1 Tax=Phormidium sp. CCY1219 TaxID=2886104 RepID=UPI002D1EF624|nr:NUDIX hydrolase [Phormidium sp. CCY1219]MEB3826356.1 NUDIX hydrolase [Phormidium sp. CCY1219]